MAPPKLSKFLWDSTSDEFLDLLQRILELTTTGNRNNCKISVVGRSGCGRGGRNEPCKKFWLFPSMQCSHNVKNGGKARKH